MAAQLELRDDPDGRSVLAVAGDLDASDSAALRDAGFAAVEDAGSGPVVMDLAGVTFADSTALGALVEIRAYADEHGSRLVLTNVPDRVVAIIALTGLDAVFTLEKQP